LQLALSFSIGQAIRWFAAGSINPIHARLGLFECGSPVSPSALAFQLSSRKFNTDLATQASEADTGRGYVTARSRKRYPQSSGQKSASLWSPVEVMIVLRGEIAV
jgi:hypothetical protein